MKARCPWSVAVVFVRSMSLMTFVDLNQYEPDIFACGP